MQIKQKFEPHESSLDWVLPLPCSRKSLKISVEAGGCVCPLPGMMFFLLHSCKSHKVVIYTIYIFMGIIKNSSSSAGCSWSVLVVIFTLLVYA